MPVPRKTIAAIRKGKYAVKAKYPEDRIYLTHWKSAGPFKYRDTLAERIEYLEQAQGYHEECLAKYCQFETDLVTELGMSKHPKRRKLLKRVDTGTRDLETIARDFGELVDLVS